MANIFQWYVTMINPILEGKFIRSIRIEFTRYYMVIIEDDGGCEERGANRANYYRRL